MKIPFKDAAKKAYKQLSTGKYNPMGCTYAQFLDEFSRWIGYRNYHEACLSETKNEQFKKAYNNPKIASKEKSLGLTTSQRTIHRVFDQLTSPGTKTAIIGMSGTGKTQFVKEFICYVLANTSKRIRIIDYGNNYPKGFLLQALGNFEASNVYTLDNWNSNQRLVYVDIERCNQRIREFNFFGESEDFAKDTVYIMDEIYFNPIVRAQSSNFNQKLQEKLITTVVTAQEETDWPAIGLDQSLFNVNIRHIDGSGKTNYYRLPSHWQCQITKYDEEFLTNSQTSLKITNELYFTDGTA